MLAQMPLPFVHRLRDLRIKQLEEQTQEQSRQMQNHSGNGAPFPPVGAGFDSSAIEDFVDELS